jgi:flagellar hook assembly protein FlgD
MKRLVLLFFLCTGTLYSQTYYMNVWSHGKVTSIPIQEIQKFVFSNISNAVGNEEVTTVIKSFKLLQNFPNPFNPSTTIEYQIPAVGVVEIKIFSVNGQLVKTFLATHASSGSYTVTWDGKNETGQFVTSGLYIYQVSFSNSVVAKKMMFVK